jgi:hypothetical protein
MFGPEKPYFSVDYIVSRWTSICKRFKLITSILRALSFSFWFSFYHGYWIWNSITLNAVNLLEFQDRANIHCPKNFHFFGNLSSDFLKLSILLKWHFSDILIAIDCGKCIEAHSTWFCECGSNYWKYDLADYLQINDQNFHNT